MSTSTVLVTGATSGIGRSAAGSLVAAGWEVWVTGRDRQRTEQTAGELGGRPLVMDVTDPRSVAAAAASIDRLDALVNNAGVQPDFGIDLLDTDAALFRRTYDTNVFGVVEVTNAFVPVLRRSLAPRIVNVSSGTSSFAWSTGPNPQFDYEAAANSGGRFAAYRSSKVALNALTLYYAQTLSDIGFKVNALAPGIRRTNLNPSTRGGDPAEASAAIVKLVQLPDDGPTGRLFSYDGMIAPW